MQRGGGIASFYTDQKNLRVVAMDLLLSSLPNTGYHVAGSCQWGRRGNHVPRISLKVG